MPECQESTQGLLITLQSGIIAGIMGKLICHPLDTIRAKIQIRQNVQVKLQSGRLISNLFFDTIRTEGVRGLFRGAGVTILGTGPAYSLYLTTFEFSKSKFQKLDLNNHIASFLAGMTAETISCLLWLPIDVIKERMQVQSTLKIYTYNGTLDAVKKILATEGVIGLYRAYGATIASFGPFSAFYFMFYDSFKSYLKNPSSPTFLQSLVLSGLAGSLAGLICNPLDIIKLRMQVQRCSRANESQIGNFGYRNLIHGLYTMVVTEGVLSLSKGALVKVLYACPNTAISMSIAEVTRNYLTVGNVEQ